MVLKIEKPETRNPLVIKANIKSVEAQGGRELIKDIEFNFKSGDKIAIIGEEGNGKSTLAKIIAGEKLPEGFSVFGNVERGGNKIGYLSQSLSEEWLGCSVADFFIKDKPTEEIDYEKYNEIAKIQAAITEVGLDPKIMESKLTIDKLSGGEKVKLQIAKLLWQEPDFLVLDEPTNNLDLETIEWMEDFIRNTKVGVIFISHDEYLLANTANRVIHLEQQKRKSVAKSTINNVDYSTYVEGRNMAIGKQEAQAALERRKKRKSLIILRSVKASVHSQAESILDATMRRTMAKKEAGLARKQQQILNTELTDKPDVEEGIKFEFSETSIFPQGKIAVDLHLAGLEVGLEENKKMLCAKKIDYTKNGPGMDIIIGKNGSGKTTLLKKILENMQERGLKPAYFPQDYSEILTDPDKTAVEYLMDEKISETEARTMMGRMKFTPDEMLQKVSELSGGQKAKLILLMLTFSGKNILVLDEPTRNLSPLSAPALREALREFPGATIVVTHDRAFIEELGERIFELDENGLNQVDVKKLD
ncbi:MAG TPA: ABC-F family ATP-binding cassette domain-containing protein [bacterium]|nr:ABC-F family ATP-binding cassette domain-containing protein [bacterium]